MHVKFYLNFLWESVVVQKVEKGRFYDKAGAMVQGIVKICCWNKNNSIENKLSRKKGWAWWCAHLVSAPGGKFIFVSLKPTRAI